MHSTQNTDCETEFLAGSPVSQSSGPAAREALIIPFISNSRPTAAALLALEEASSLDTFESLGELAVRLVGSWSLPKLVVMTATGGEAP